MLLSTLVLLLTSAAAHPGESHELPHHQKAARMDYMSYVKREGGNCNALARRSTANADNHRNKIAQLRRQVQAEKRMKRGIEEDIYRYATIDHESDRTDITADISLDDLFTSDDATCLLQPEATEGPYWITGEFIRQDITDGVDGVPLYFAVDFFDVATCEPIPNIWLEVWHANAVGVYSGVKAETNDNGADHYNETFCRGIQETGENGAASFKSVFPGNYDGRAIHIHILAHTNVTVYENNTIGSGTDSGSIIHVGQLFFDQSLIDETKKLEPYASNTQPMMENLDDNILGLEEIAGAPDPFFKYVRLGDDLQDGLYAWASVGINVNESITIWNAAYYDAEGGHDTGHTYTPPENIRGPGPRSRGSSSATSGGSSEATATDSGVETISEATTGSAATDVATGAAASVKPMAIGLTVLGLGSFLAMYI